jgi:hypothetical protein
MVTLNLGEAPRTERTFAQIVSGNYFSALGLRPTLGRFLSPEEVARAGGEPVLVVSYEFWQNRLGGTSSALGKTILVNERELTIVSVAPRGFQGTVMGLRFDLWAAATLAPVLFAGSRELEDCSMRGYAVTGIPLSGVTRAQAQAELDAAMSRLAQLYPETNSKMRGGSASLLELAARSAAFAGARPDDPAGHYDAPAARRVR